MKALLLPILSLAVLTTGAFAAPKADAPVGSSQYRPVPKASANETGKGRYRVAAFKPTQFYYTRDSVISYRYSVQAVYGGSVDTSSYLGPTGAVFVPQEGEMPPSATLRSFASVTRRSQPGVGMVAPAPVIIKKTRTTKTTSLSTKTATEAGLAVK